MSKKFSIVVPTFNNIKYLKLCIESIIKNSSTSHQLVVHVNGLDQDTEFFLDKQKFYILKQILMWVCVPV